MTRVAILISGSGSNMEALIRDMQAQGYATPALVISNRPGAGGLDRAHALGVPTQVIDHRGRDRTDFDAELAAALNAAQPDVTAHAGFMRILSPDFFQQFTGAMLNIHPSLLPKYPGLNTHARALDAGDAEAGCSVHEVIPDLDAGPILGQARVPVHPGDTPETLAARILPREHALYPQVLRRYIAGERSLLTL